MRMAGGLQPPTGPYRQPRCRSAGQHHRPRLARREGVAGVYPGYNEQAVTNKPRVVIAAEVMTDVPDFR